MATRDNLTTQIRAAKGDELSVRWTDTFIWQIMDDAVKQLSRIVRNYTKTTTLNIIALGRGTVPTDFIDIIDLRFTSTGNPIWPVDFRDTRGFNPASTGNVPNYYVIVGQEIQFYPKPSVNYSVDIRYFATAPLLSTGASVPDPSLGTDADAYIKAFVCKELSLTEQDYDAFGIFQAQVVALEGQALATASKPDAFSYAQIFSSEAESVWTD